MVIVNMYHLDFRRVKFLGRLPGCRRERKVENAKDDIGLNALLSGRENGNEELPLV